jgi:signal transduction histidine kinase
VAGPRQTALLRRIVEALLFLTRPDAEADLAGLEGVDLAAWLPEQLRRRAGHARAADLRLSTSLGGPLTVRVLPLLLDQLLDNALKYSELGTPVTVALGRELGVVALAVEDAGPGITAEDLPHAFEPFYRSADAWRRERAGIGLGLAMVRRITAAFCGTVAAESERGAAAGSRYACRSLFAGQPPSGIPGRHGRSWPGITGAPGDHSL